MLPWAWSVLFVELFKPGIERDHLVRRLPCYEDDAADGTIRGHPHAQEAFPRSLDSWASSPKIGCSCLSIDSLLGFLILDISHPMAGSDVCHRTQVIPEAIQLLKSLATVSLASTLVPGETSR